MTTELASEATPADAAAADRDEAAPGERPAWKRRWRWVPDSLRARIVAAFIGVLVLTTLGSVLVTYQVSVIRLDQRIDAELAQEAAELRRLATGSDPLTGEPFGARAVRIFDVFLRRNVPLSHEVLITFVGGKTYARSPRAVPYQLDEDPALVARWASLARPERGRVSTPAGRVEYLAVPLRSEGTTRGVFVAAIFRDRAKADADSVVLAAGAVGLGVLLIGSLLAWRLADRVVRPVSALTRTARSISETDLSARIPEQGRDEVAQLAATFNDMLDRLERGFASQRRFVDDASHELKTPLTIIRGHLELLDDDPDERRQTIALVTDELDRMRRIVDDLLLLAGYEEPDFLDLGALDVAALTDELVAKASALGPYDWQLDSRGSGVIVADRQRLTQAMMQLAQNAARHGGAELIELGSSVGPGEARFWVRDHGAGIPAHQQERIFERFRRGSAPRRTEGAGLGLAIVKAIAEAHGGRVELESAPGRGTVFTIVVPVDQPPERGRRA